MTTFGASTQRRSVDGLQSVVPLEGPVKANIEVVRACNIRCPACPVGSGIIHHYPMMRPEDYKRIIDAISSTVEKLALFNYGEPLLHPKIEEFVRYAKQSGIKEVLIHSNGLLLTLPKSQALIDAHLDQLTVSVDGVNQETYVAYRRGGNFALLKKNLEGIVELKRQQGMLYPRLVAQFIIMAHNERYVQQFATLMKEIGVDEISFKTFNVNMELGFGEDHTSMIPMNHKLSRCGFLANNKFKADPRRACPWPRKQLVVNVDGTIVSCCYDYNNFKPLGYMLTSDETKWWKTHQRMEFIRQLAAAPDSLEPCRQCPMGKMNVNIAEFQDER